MRKGKDRTRLSDLLRVVLERYASQISFTRLAQQCQHLSVETVIDYLRHLERLDIVRVLTAFDQNTLGSFPKKDKKIHATDPFLVQVLIRWLNERELLGQNFQIDQSLLVESVVVAHAARIAPVYYIKAEGEVDVVMVRSGEFFPIEVKWSEHVRTGDLKQVLKYPQSVVLTRRREEGTIQGVPIKNILQFLLLLESSSPR